MGWYGIKVKQWNRSPLRCNGVLASVPTVLSVVGYGQPRLAGYLPPGMSGRWINVGSLALHTLENVMKNFRAFLFPHKVLSYLSKE